MDTWRNKMHKIRPGEKVIIHKPIRMSEEPVWISAMNQWNGRTAEVKEIKNHKDGSSPWVTLVEDDNNFWFNLTWLEKAKKLNSKDIQSVAERLVDGETVIHRESDNSMAPIIKSRQPVELEPISWYECNIGDIVYCKVHGRFYTHRIKAADRNKGVLIGNDHGGVNGWTKQVFGLVVKIMKDKPKPNKKENERQNKDHKKPARKRKSRA